jgi:hypothetical protein
MKVGRGFLDLMSRSKRKRISNGHRPVLYTAALIVLAAGLALAGCGDISLSGLLEKQAPGELGITPQTATIYTDSTIEISGTGGFTPYSFSVTAGSVDEIDGVTYFTAPASATPDVIITVVDALSSEATAIIQVESSMTNPFSFPEAMTIAVGESTGFIQATGGDISVTGKYTFSLEPAGAGTLVAHPSFPEDRVKYVAPDYVPTEPILVHSTDDIGQVSTLEITVVAVSGS